MPSAKDLNYKADWLKIKGIELENVHVFWDMRACGERFRLKEQVEVRLSYYSCCNLERISRCQFAGFFPFTTYVLKGYCALSLYKL